MCPTSSSRGLIPTRRYTRLNEDPLVDVLLEDPRANARRLAELLAARGVKVSARTIRNHLPGLRMRTMADRAFGFYALQYHKMRSCSEEVLKFIDLFQPGLRELSEPPPCPGYLFHLDIVDAFRLPSQPHLTVYVYVLVDVYSGYACASFQTIKSEWKVTDVLLDEFLPEFSIFAPHAFHFRVQHVLTDSARAFYRSQNYTHPVMFLFKIRRIKHHIVNGELKDQSGLLRNVRDFIRRKVIDPATAPEAPKKSIEQLRYDLAHEINDFNYNQQLSFRPSLNPDPKAPRQSPFHILLWLEQYKNIPSQTRLPYQIPGRRVTLPRRPYRSIESRFRVGFRFERYLAKWLRSKGLTRTIRMRKSGHRLKQPYDAFVPELNLKVEAKWRTSHEIRISKGDLNKITEDFILVFSIKNYLERHRDIERHRGVYAVSPWIPPRGELRTPSWLEPGFPYRYRESKFVSTPRGHKGRKKIRLIRIKVSYRTISADLLHGDLLLESNGKYYLAEPILDFLELRWEKMHGDDGG